MPIETTCLREIQFKNSLGRMIIFLSKDYDKPKQQKYKLTIKSYDSNTWVPINAKLCFWCDCDFICFVLKMIQRISVKFSDFRFLLDWNRMKDPVQNVCDDQLVFCNILAKAWPAQNWLDLLDTGSDAVLVSVRTPFVNLDHWILRHKKKFVKKWECTFMYIW